MKKIEDIINYISHVTKLFYQNKLHEGYQELERLITIIDDTLLELSEDEFSKLERNKITTVLTDAMNAMEQQDSLLLADILEYELKEIFQELIIK